MKKKKYIVAGILAAAGVICAAVSIYLYFDQKNAGDEYEKLRGDLDAIKFFEF